MIGTSEIDGPTMTPAQAVKVLTDHLAAVRAGDPEAIAMGQEIDRIQAEEREHQRALDRERIVWLTATMGADGVACLREHAEELARRP